MRREAEIAANRFQLTDEQVRGKGDDAQGDDGLQAGPGEVGIAGTDFQRLQLVFLFVFAGARGDFAPDIYGIGRQEEHAQPRLIGKGDEAQPDLDDEDGQKGQLVVGQALAVRLYAVIGALEFVLIEPQGQADNTIGNGRQHQRSTHGRADADILLLRRMAKGDGGEGHGAFRQGGSEGGQNSADRRSAQLHVLTAPFDRVDEIFAGEIDRQGRA